ncbi:MAG TPA: hypothetical protein VFO19_23340 [Vicinamibacterales bacterium]|nr:hypothetical protein [Vicinamibacterales bacterium]
MRRLLNITLACALALSVTLAAAPKFVSTWKAPEAANVSFAGKKVAALIVTDDQSLQMSGEEALVRELAAVGLPNGISSIRIVPREELRDPEKARGWYEKQNVDGVVAMRLVKTDTRKTWTPVTWTSPTYSSFWGYYGYSWSSLNEAGYLREDAVVVVETLVFSVPMNKLLWAGVTESTNPKDVQRGIRDIVKATVKEMQKHGLARKAVR